jgi:molybdenum cofactor cytidylyltransferase
MSAGPPIRGVLLAAGAARRFGSGKLVQPLPGTSTALVVAAWRNLVAVLPESVAVCRPGDEAVATLLAAEGIPFVVCPDADRGMGHSLARGVEAAQPASGWLIALGDMPRVAPASIEAVAEALRRGAGIAVPVHAGRRGHPVGFAAHFGAQLRALQGDSGARAVVQANADAVQLVALEDDPGILADVDTPEDLARLR